LCIHDDNYDLKSGTHEIMICRLCRRRMFQMWHT